MPRPTKQAPKEPPNSFTNKTILLVNTGSSKKKFIVQKLHRMGLEIVCLNKEKNWADQYVDHWILGDTNNHPESIQAVKSFFKANPSVRVDGIITFWEDDVLLTSKLIDRFHFLGIPYNIAKRIRNKFSFRSFCREHGLPAPRHILIKTDVDLKTVIKNLTFPVVIKPTYGTSSAFVVKVEKKENFLETIEYVRSNISTTVESALAEGLDIFVEEYIDGDEVDIDLLVQNGKVKFCSISDNFDKSKDIFFIDRGQSIPSSLPLATQEALTAMAEEVLEKLGIENACIHFEAKTTKQGTVPIEVNLRMGGDYVYSYTKDALDVDLIENVVKIAIGEYIKPIKMTKPKKYIVGWDLHSEYSGMLVELTIDPSVKTKPFIEDMQINKQIGDPILVPPQGYEYLGWLTVSGDSLLDAQDNLRLALEDIEYHVVPFDKESALGKTSRKSRFSAAVLQKEMAIGAAKLGQMLFISRTNQRKLHIGVLDNRHRSSEPMTHPIAQSLHALGYPVSVYPMNTIGKMVQILKQEDVNLFLPIATEVFGNPELSPSVVSLLNLFQLPHIGSTAFTRYLCMNKIALKKLLKFHALPMPRWNYVYDTDDPIDESLKFPLMVKPSLPLGNENDHATHHVVKKKGELRPTILRLLKKTKSPLIIEEFIPANEYDAYIIGNDGDQALRVLPLTKGSEVGEEKKQHRSKKWISAKLQTLITEIALDAYNIVDCFDYGRVVIRIDEQGNPFVLSIDPNPPLDADGEFAHAAALAGMEYEDLLEEIIHGAIKRYAASSAGDVSFLKHT